MNKTKNKINYGLGENIFNVANHLFLAFCAFLTLYPFINTLAVSFSSNAAILSGRVSMVPVDLSLDAYNRIVKDGSLFLAMKNTLILTVVGTAINMVITIMCAYPLSRKYFPGKKFFMIMITITMFFGGGLIPTFVLMKALGLMNKYSGLWLLSLFGTYNMIILRTCFQGLPDELEESAAIEGANDIIILLRIMLPMAKPVLATLTLFYSVGWWNSFMAPLLYISDPKKITLMLKLRQLIDIGTAATAYDPTTINVIIAPESLKAASTMITAIPILCVYPFLQRYFVKGVMVGSLKG